MSTELKTKICTDLVFSFIQDTIPYVLSQEDGNIVDVFIVLENMTAGAILFAERMGAPRKVVFDAYIESLTKRLQEL